MQRRERFKALLSAAPTDRQGFWLGNPHEDALPIYLEYFGARDHLDLADKIQDDFWWEMAENSWAHPEGAPIFDPLGGKERISLSQDGIFAECEDWREVERYPWPDARFLDLDALERKIDSARARGMGVASGCWSPFFHLACDFFGMENYFVKMYTDPDVVQAVTEKLVEFYLQVNERIFNRLGSKIDAYFFGNDLGSQRDLLISPESFDTFVKPYMKRLCDQAHKYSLPVMLHTCGAVSKIIPQFIEVGIQGLHPLQARAEGMDAQSLSRYKNDLLFVGGVDTQSLLPFGSAEDVRKEVDRLHGLFGDRWIVSPSHEALLSNVPAENVDAMRRAAQKL